MHCLLTKHNALLQIKKNINIILIYYYNFPFIKIFIYNEEKRISKNYISLFLSISDKKQNNLFFKEYFNTLAQSVFYSFFYAFPKSRSKFDNKLKEELLTVFSKIFTGIEISNKKCYFEKWTLDLGTGNILARKTKKL